MRRKVDKLLISSGLNDTLIFSGELLECSVRIRIDVDPFVDFANLISILNLR